MSKQSNSRRNKKSTSFRIGRVRAYLRGRVWYLCYYEDRRRHQPRVGPDLDVVRQMAAEINAQLEVGAPSALWFQPVSVVELRQRWLDYHEHVRRSSVATVRRYRQATEHLLNFVQEVRPLRRVSDFRPAHAEEFVRYLRTIRVPLQGPADRHRRPLRDTGVKYILETCSILFNYAQKNRHLSPYAENPFQTIEIGRIPVEDARPIIVFTPEQEAEFFNACDNWQFPLFLTLLMTGLRSAELTHLLLPDDLDLDNGWLYVRNKPKLGWRVKTRNERDIPLVPVLVDVLRAAVDGRSNGPAFRRRRCGVRNRSMPVTRSRSYLERELIRRRQRREAELGRSPARAEEAQIAWTLWRDMGAIHTRTIYQEFGRIAASIGLAHVTAPKTFRHTFATMLQDANVDPLVRNELMGHVPAAASASGVGLAMTAVYTHTRPETKRQQLERALANRPALEAARRWPARPTLRKSSISAAVPDSSWEPSAGPDDCMQSTGHSNKGIKPK
jgi:integrase